MHVSHSSYSELLRAFSRVSSRFILGAAFLCSAPALWTFPIAAPAEVRIDAARTHVVNVRTFGAIGNGEADDTAALQRALNGGRRTVLIPAGTYSIRAALLLDSDTVIQADPNAVIQLAAGAGNSVDIFLLRNRDATAGNHDIVIDGGIWDGNNAQNPRGAVDRIPCYTGAGFHFFNVQRLEVRHVTLRNPETYAIRAARLTDFVFEDIGFDFSSVRENQDGVHLNGYCERGVIRNLRALSPFATNDDMVALNADDGAGEAYVFQQGMIPGPIRDITVQHLRAPSVFTFVRLLSNQQPLENIRISDIVGGCRFYAVNMDRWRFPTGGGKIRNVTLSDLSVHKAFDTFSRQSHPERRPLVHIQTAVENFRIENFQRTAEQQPPAVTLLVDNGQTNHLRLAGLTIEQQQALLAASPAVSPNSFSAENTASATSRRTLQIEARTPVTLPDGGFSLLELNPSRNGK